MFFAQYYFQNINHHKSIILNMTLEPTIKHVVYQLCTFIIFLTLAVRLRIRDFYPILKNDGPYKKAIFKMAILLKNDLQFQKFLNL